MGGPVNGLPPQVRHKAAHLGAEGERWLRDLPGVVAELSGRWSVTVTGPPLPGGSAAYVARVRTGDGREAVLKIALPGHGPAGQMRTLAAARGRGYVRLPAAAGGLEETAIWEWGFLERVSSGLYCLRVGLDDPGRPLPATAGLLVDA
ncbi:hypothetical protein [Thermomonospora amylolytica]|uniref:hypothetical protein n=1 Tax=Thermomonospora amylolytica TaxID=1411117 RepID=UPI000E6C2E3B|nr:hypothetical protein [Thermomonospora amylolytica]